MGTSRAPHGHYAAHTWTPPQTSSPMAATKDFHKSHEACQTPRSHDIWLGRAHPKRTSTNHHDTTIWEHHMPHTALDCAIAEALTETIWENLHEDALGHTHRTHNTASSCGAGRNSIQTPANTCASDKNHRATLTFRCDKVLRPGAIHTLRTQGLSPCAIPLGHTESTYYMVKKLAEEARETLESLQRGDMAHMWKELADTYEALENVLSAMGKNWEDLRHMVHHNQAKEGAYANGLVLKSITLPATHPKVKKYSASHEYALQS